MITSDPKLLAVELLARFDQGAIIGIDGWTGVGKSTLAKALTEETGGTSYDIDEALDRDRQCYTSALRLDEIEQNLSGEGLLFVSGICLRQVLELVKVQAEAYVYVKRMATWGWADEDDVFGKIPEITGASGETLRQELRHYHSEWTPHLSATFEFHRWD